MIFPYLPACSYTRYTREQRGRGKCNFQCLSLLKRGSRRRQNEHHIKTDRRVSSRLEIAPWKFLSSMMTTAKFPDITVRETRHGSQSALRRILNRWSTTILLVKVRAYKVALRFSQHDPHFCATQHIRTGYEHNSLLKVALDLDSCVVNVNRALLVINAMG